MGISSQVQKCPLGCDSKLDDMNKMYNNLDRLYNDSYKKVQTYQQAVRTLESQKDWYVKTQFALEERIRVLTFELQNTSNTLIYTESLHAQAQKEKKEWEVKFLDNVAKFDKWKESSKNLKKLIDSSMSYKTKCGLGYKDYFGEDDVHYKNSVFDPEPFNLEDKPLHRWFVKSGHMHEVQPSITGSFRPTSYTSDLSETQVNCALKPNKDTSETTLETNDFVSCDNSDKSSDSEAYLSCGSSPVTKTNDSPPPVDVKTEPKSDVEVQKTTIGSPSFSCSENVKSPRINCNKSGLNNRILSQNNFVRVKKCFVCGSKLHLIKDCDYYDNADSVPCKPTPASVSAANSAASRNRPAAFNSADRPVSVSAGRPVPVSADRPISAGFFNPAARPYFGPNPAYFNNYFWPEIYHPMNMYAGQWGTAVKPSAGYSWKKKRPNYQGSKSNGGSSKSTWFHS